MLIRYATGHRWYKEVTDEVIDQFGKNDAARLRSTLKKVAASGVRHVIEPLSDSFLDRFFAPVRKTHPGKRESDRFRHKDQDVGKSGQGEEVSFFVLV